MNEKIFVTLACVFLQFFLLKSSATAETCRVVEQALFELAFTHGSFAVQLEMGHKNTFQQDSLYLKEMTSPDGSQIILAGRVNFSSKEVVELTGVTISTDNSRLTTELGSKNVLGFLRIIKKDFSELGFKQLTIIGVRRTGGNVGKTVTRKIELD